MDKISVLLLEKEALQAQIAELKELDGRRAIKLIKKDNQIAELKNTIAELEEEIRWK